MPYEKQPDNLPTNKLAVGSSVAVLIYAQAEPVVAEVWPQIAPAVLSGPAATAFVAGGVAILASWAIGWWVPDRAGAPK